MEAALTELSYKAAKAHLLEAFEREYTQSVLDRCAGNVSKAARTAGIDRVYLHRLIKKYGLRVPGGLKPRPIGSNRDPG